MTEGSFLKGKNKEAAKPKKQARFEADLVQKVTDGMERRARASLSPYFDCTWHNVR